MGRLALEPHFKALCQIKLENDKSDETSAGLLDPFTQMADTSFYLRSRLIHFF